MSETEFQLLCKNIFKDGKTTTSKDKFTGAWINLINQLEKDKKYIRSPENKANSQNL